MIDFKGETTRMATSGVLKNKNTSNINSDLIPKNKVTLFITMYNKIHAIEGTHLKATKKIGVMKNFIYRARGGRVELGQARKVLAAFNAILKVEG